MTLQSLPVLQGFGQPWHVNIPLSCNVQDSHDTVISLLCKVQDIHNSVISLLCKDQDSHATVISLCFARFRTSKSTVSSLLHKLQDLDNTKSSLLCQDEDMHDSVSPLLPTARDCTHQPALSTGLIQTAKSCKCKVYRQWLLPAWCRSERSMLRSSLLIFSYKMLT